jgi:hypothetical protein
MGIITELLHDIPLPRMVRVSQKFQARELHDISASLVAELRRPDIANRIKKGLRIAVAVGSRGMSEVSQIVQTVIKEIRRCGADPFIVPAMGSHGGATSEGQKKILASLRITESLMGCPIISSMEVVRLGVIDNGLPVLLDKAASEADGIIVINRIKAHSAFSGPIESGMAKMIAIGLGKQKGADACHALGFQYMAESVIKMAEISLSKAPFLFGIGTIENAYDRVAKIVAVPAEAIIGIEQALLLESKANMPRLLLQPVDVLLVDQLGKEFSGSGMDPHITGRASTIHFKAGPQPNKLVVLDITGHSGGNATGIGMADFTTRRLFSEIDFESTYANVITSTAPQAARIPLIMDSDSLAIQAAVKTCNVLNLNEIRMVRIPNTLNIQEIYISECMLKEAELLPDISIIGEPLDFAFDGKGNLNDIGNWA